MRWLTSIVRVAHALVESKRAPLEDFGAVRHDADAVQRRLPIEEHDVVVDEVALHDVAHLQLGACTIARVVAKVLKAYGASAVCSWASVQGSGGLETPAHMVSLPLSLVRTLSVVESISLCSRSPTHRCATN